MITVLGRVGLPFLSPEFRKIMYPRDSTLDENTMMTMDSIFNNETTTKTPEDALKNLTPSEITFIFIGLAIITTNTALIVYFYKDKNSVWSTSFFLSNLAFSDVLTGIMLIAAVLHKILEPENMATMCRFNIGTIGVLSSIMSACCILLLSIQVRSQLLILPEAFLTFASKSQQKFYRPLLCNQWTL